jgi:hypothetical protein
MALDKDVLFEFRFAWTICWLSVIWYHQQLQTDVKDTASGGPCAT